MHYLETVWNVQDCVPNVCISSVVASYHLRYVISIFKSSVVFVIYFRRKLSLNLFIYLMFSEQIQLFYLPAFMAGEQKENLSRVVFHVQFKVAAQPGLEQEYVLPIRVRGCRLHERGNVCRPGWSYCQPQILGGGKRGRWYV